MLPPSPVSGTDPPCPGWSPALAIPNHGHGAKGSQGEKGAPGTMEHSPRSLPRPGTWSPAPHSTGAAGVRQADGEQGWCVVGRQWVACLTQRDSCCGCPRAALQDPAPPRRQAPGLAAPKGRRGSRAMQSTLLRRDPPPRLAPSILGDLCPPKHAAPLGRGRGGDSPSWTPAGPPDRVTAGRPGAQRPAGWACAPMGAGGWGPSWKDAPHRPPPPPRPSDVLVPRSAAERAAGPAEEPCLCQACS